MRMAKLSRNLFKMFAVWFKRFMLLLLLIGIVQSKCHKNIYLHRLDLDQMMTSTE